LGASTPGSLPGAAGRLPFGPAFQLSLFRLIVEDAAFAAAVAGQIRPGYFEAEPLAWGYAAIESYRARYNATPRLNVLLEEARRLPVPASIIYTSVLEQVANADLSAEQWLRDQTLEFVKRNLFVRAWQDSLGQYNQGDVQAAYKTMTEAMDQISRASWEVEDQEWFFENFQQRYSDRLGADPSDGAICTGIPGVDRVLGGGLHLGELGIWIADAKKGKTTLLTNHGAQAVKRGLHTVLHAVYEGGRKQVANRYDTLFAQESYADVRRSGISEDVYRRMLAEYAMYSARLLLRGFTQDWNYSVANLHELLRRLKRQHGWRPELVIVDYGDLLRSRDRQESETGHQRAAFRDLKTLSNQGYAVWTASQAQRPKKDTEDDSELLRARSIADCYDKVRCADFLGTINRTREERLALRARLYCELYRDNEADLVVPVYADFDKMTIGALPPEVPLGYVQTASGLPLPTATVVQCGGGQPTKQDEIPF
jgi:hypothetical protein